MRERSARGKCFFAFLILFQFTTCQLGKEVFNFSLFNDLCVKSKVLFLGLSKIRKLKQQLI